MVDVNQVPLFYQGYLDPSTKESVGQLLERSRDDFSYLLNTFSNEKAQYRYAEDKWSVKDLVQHVIDAERVFAYRALRFARNDQTDLSGFEQDDYVAVARADDRTIEDLMDEFTVTRNSTISLFQFFKEEELARSGTASGSTFTVETMGYLISGHLLHHLKVIREKYL